MKSVAIFWYVFIIIISITSCSQDPVPGCTDSNATNYNSSANEDDGTCTYWIDGQGGESFSGIRCLASNGSSIAAGATSCIFYSNDEGSNWTWACNGILYDKIINAVLIVNNIIFAGTEGRGIYASTDNGLTWSEKSNGFPIPSPPYYSIAIINCFAVSGNYIFAGTHQGIYVSSDNGDNWSLVNNGLSNLPIISLATNGNNIFAGTDGDGIYLSTDLGNSWTAVNNGFGCGHGMTVNSILVYGNKIFVGSAGCGLFMSTNNGASWNHVTTAFVNTGTNVNALAAINNKIFAAADGIYISSDDGNTWIKENINIINPGSISLIISNNYVYAEWGGHIIKRLIPQ